MRTILVLAVLFLAGANCVSFPTPLQTFVWNDDGSFAWSIFRQPFRNKHSTTYFLNVTTTKWLTPADVSVPVWHCQALVTVPDDIDPAISNWAALYNDGGEIGQSPPVPDQIGFIFAETLKGIVVHLLDIPNEPIVFADDPSHSRRSEDGLIAWGWLHFLRNPTQPEWLLRLPMVKSVIKTMDAVQQFLPTIGKPVPQKFLVAGASKRGWTAWLTPAVDERVGAIVPMVMPVLNMVPCINDMWRSLGEWTFAFKDYTNLNVTDWLWTPQMLEMAAIIDPIVYMPYLAKVPKYLMFATNDEFFLPDSARTFFPQMIAEGGETHLRMMENADHPLVPLDLVAIYNIASFAELVFRNQPRPSLKEVIDYSNTTATITVYPSAPPQVATLWQATTYSKTRRDFRFLNCTSMPQCFQPNFWLPKTISPRPDGSYSASISAPLNGWIGFMIQLTYPSPYSSKQVTYSITSQVNIVPDVYPYPDFQPANPPRKPRYH